MALGNNQQSQSRIFLSVGFGKLRQKTLANGNSVDSNTPNAIVRTTQQGQETWALEFDNITGIIDNIFYKDNSGTKFANSFEVIIKDAGISYQISFQEDSKYWFGFAEVLPNIILSQPVTINVYDYVNKQKKHKSGINVEQFNNKNTREVDYKDNTIHPFVNSFYKEYTEDKKWIFHYNYPAPSPKINWEDKDDIKTYFIGVKKFLRGEFTRLFPNGIVKDQNVKEPDIVSNHTVLDSGSNSFLQEPDENQFPPLPDSDDLPY